MAKFKTPGRCQPGVLSVHRWSDFKPAGVCQAQPAFTCTGTSSESGTPTAETERKKPFCH